MYKGCITDGNAHDLLKPSGAIKRFTMGRLVDGGKDALQGRIEASSADAAIIKRNMVFAAQLKVGGEKKELILGSTR
jgi:hypothetical protein